MLESRSERILRREAAQKRAASQLLLTMEGLPSETIAERSKARSRYKKQGKPCFGLSKGFVALLRKGAEMLKVLMSQRVPEHVRQSRIESCRDCEHATEFDIHGDGVFRHYCQCCGCPAWQFMGIGSSMEEKVDFAALECPRPEPAFGAWIDDSTVV